ncbi:MAG: fructosamine kinase family protein [Granulosicoccus sp.]
MSIDVSWKSKAEADLGIGLDQWRALSGGDFAQSFSATVTTIDTELPKNIELEAGAQVFVKTHANPPPNHFTTEARGLEWLAQTNTVRVPAVLGVSDQVPYLAIAWIDESRQRQSSQQGEMDFGRQLAALHRMPCPSFGREDKRSTGSLGLPNQTCGRWSEFYATQRLLPLARIASDRQALSTRLVTMIESLANRLDQWESPSLVPSLLHGDLWAGNRLVDTNGDSWIIDPASHGGHREFDLSMMRLFGGYSDSCFKIYEEIFPLDEGWRERIALHQLAPLIVHAIKFGQAYVGPTEDALARFS